MINLFNNTFYDKKMLKKHLKCFFWSFMYPNKCFVCSFYIYNKNIYNYFYHKYKYIFEDEEEKYFFHSNKLLFSQVKTINNDLNLNLKVVEKEKLYDFLQKNKNVKTGILTYFSNNQDKTAPLHMCCFDRKYIYDNEKFFPRKIEKKKNNILTYKIIY